MQVEVWIGIQRFELTGWVEFVPGTPPRRVEQNGRLVGFAGGSRGSVRIALDAPPDPALAELDNTVRDGVLIEWSPDAMAFHRAAIHVTAAPPVLLIDDRP